MLVRSLAPCCARIVLDHVDVADDVEREQCVRVLFRLEDLAAAGARGSRRGGVARAW